MAESTKPLLSISVIGHVDSGKSTLTGRMASMFGALDNREQEKLAKIAAENKKDSFAFAYFTDRTEQERKKGVTINTTLVAMETDKYRINFLDCPGHADYIKNATNGCKQSDLSLVVVPADFVASCSKDGTLATHLTLSAVLGSKKFIVCVNKLDEVAEKKNEDLQTSFDAACAAVFKLMKRFGFKKQEDIPFLPISALKGIGIRDNGEKFPFFKGWDPKDSKGTAPITSIEGAINYQDTPIRPLDRPLRLPISSIAHVAGHGSIFCGRIDYGKVKKTDQVKFLPTGLKTEVKNVQAHKKDLEVGEAGMNIGFSVICKDKAEIDKVKTGHIVGPAADDEFGFYPFYVASCFSLKPKKSSSGGEERGIMAGYTPVISCGTANITCKIAKIISKDDKTQEGGKQMNPTVMLKDARYEVLLYPTKPVLFEKESKYPALSKFVARDSGIIVLAGQVIDRITEEEAVSKYGVNMAELLGQKTSAAVQGKKKK